MSALLDLKTNLKDLKFGNDQPQYGSSDQPYVQTYIPKTPLLLNLTGPGYPLYTPGGTSWGSDYPIRGGQIKFQIGQDTFTVSNDIDKTRIARFLKDKQRGTMFIQKQIGLQLSNPKIETGKATLFGVGQIVPLSGLLENTRVYNRGINTLAQVGVSGTGVHAVRHGNIPFNPFQDNYYSTVNKQNVFGNEMGSKINRLVMLTALKMVPNQNANFVNPLNFPIDVNVANSLGISYNKNLLFQYLGGPGSTYGVGSTTINRYVDTSYLADQNPRIPEQIRKRYADYGKVNTAGQSMPTNELNVEAKPDLPVSNRLLLLRESKITGNRDSYGDYEPNSAIQQYFGRNSQWGISTNNRLLFFYTGGPGAITKNEKTGQISVDKENTGIRRYTDTTVVKSSFAANYNRLAAQTINKNVYNTIDPNETGIVKAKNRDIQDYKAIPQWTTTSEDKNSKPLDYRFYVGLPGRRIDKLNKMYPFWFKNDSDPWNAKTDPYSSKDDLIKFVFEAVSNNDPSISTAIFFRAHLNGSITDNNTATWNSFKYAGRGENFYTYQGFDRSINFSFKVYASSQGEMRPMYNRLNNLISQVYPDYSSAGIMRAPVMRLTIGDYIKRMPGFLQNVNITVDQNSSWEVLEEGLYSQLPHMIDVNVSFTPILSQLPARANSIRTPYMPSIIANKEGYISSTVSDDGSAVENRAPKPEYRDPSAIDKETVDRAEAYLLGAVELQEQQQRLKEQALLNLTTYSQEQREKIQSQYFKSKKIAIEAPTQFGKAPNKPLYELENKESDPNDY